MRRIEHIIVHCTDSEWGNVDSVRRLHVHERGWADIGYHYVVTNCYPTFDALHTGRPDIVCDGKVQAGRAEEVVGAHALGWNDRSIGVSMVGRRGSFTGAQIHAAVTLCKELAYRFEVPFKNVIGHYETGANKTCPDIDMDYFRHLLRQES